MDLLDRYESDGYVIVPDLIPHSKIDRLVTALERFKHGRRPYYSESIHTWMLPELDDRGFLVQSMENFTRLWFANGIAEAGNDIVLGPEIDDVMRALKPGHDRFVHWLNHFFDRSTGSVDHIDHWYLDTDPPGHLIGAWVALEDIHPEAGPFRVFPRTHTMPEMRELWSMDHDRFVRHCAKLAERLEWTPVIIKKGTVVFFGPFLLHGAIDQTDRRYSRKSVTAHYRPLGMAKLERRGWEDLAKKSQSAAAAMTARTIGGHPIAVSHSFQDELTFNLRGLVGFAKTLITGPRPITMDMRRKSWAER
jgi:phytanoyl-CoA hydroxylase